VKKMMKFKWILFLAMFALALATGDTTLLATDTILSDPPEPISG
jgi:hypothetical protein